MNSRVGRSQSKPLLWRAWGPMSGLGIFLWLSVGMAARGLPRPAKSRVGVPSAQTGSAALPGISSTSQQAPEQQSAGNISGTVFDQSGVGVAGARVSLKSPSQPTAQQTETNQDGQFSFAHVAPGPFRLTINAPNFKAQAVSGNLHSGQSYTVPRIVLALAPVVTKVKVTPSRAFMAKYQMQQEEKQLVLGFVPNYYVTYHPHAVPLNTKQKFQLAWKTVFNPFTLGLTAAFAGGEQAAGMYSGFGTGAEGYGKRFGAAYATLGVSTFIGDALLPSLLKQDPRFFYKGNGSFGSRFLYAITRSVICKGDNGRWEPDYSAILGHFAAGGIDNLYFPPQNRKGLGLTLEGGLIGIGFDAANNLLQEFVIPKLTPHLSIHHLAKR